jgi:cysteine desulfurase
MYFDAHATTPCDPRVVEAMLPYFTDRFGNAASRQHPFGWAAREAVERGRGEVASLLGARPKDIVFTSGATESNNLALKGIVEARRAIGRHVVTVATEHQSVLDACAWLERGGCEVTRLGVDRDGLVDLRALERALRPDTILVSVMAANNEIGVLQPLEAIGRLTRARQIAFHTDAAQAVGKIPLDVEALGLDLLSLTAHKMYGPKGIGALYVRRRGPASDLLPILHGGGHERGLRSGTLNVPGIVGFGAAASLARESVPSDASRLTALRDRLLAALREHVGEITVNGSLSARLPHNLNVTVAGVDGSRLLQALTDVGVSSGAACSSATAAPSHVLLALGLSDEEAKASLRFGLLRSATEADIEYAVERIAAVAADLRQNRVRR